MGNSLVGIAIIFLTSLVSQGEGMFVRRYGKLHGSGGMLFNAVVCLFAMVYYFVTDADGLQFSQGILIYGIINSFMYAIGFYSAYIAFRIGSFGLTRLFTSFGMLISTFYGILVLNEPTTKWTYISLGLILISMFLINYHKSGYDEGQKISFKWVLTVILIIVSNGFISIIGRMQFDMFGDTFKNEYLIISYAGAVLFLCIFALIFERNGFKEIKHHLFTYGALAGACNGMANLLALITYNYLPISFISPFRTGVGITLGFATSIVLYKEKFSRRQMISVAIGIVAVVIMNLK